MNLLAPDDARPEMGPYLNKGLSHKRYAGRGKYRTNSKETGLMNRGKLIVLGALLAVAGAAGAQMSDEQAERAVETRQSLLQVMVWNYGPMGAMARGRIDFDTDRVKTNAERLVALSKMMSDAFAADTRSNDVDTEALDVIWEQPDDFAAKIEATIEASNALVAAAATGDEGVMTQAIGRVGSTCGSCHDDFRLDD